MIKFYIWYKENMHKVSQCVSELFLTFREKEVGVLHSEFGMDYDSVIRSVIESEIKNAAVPYSVDQFRLQRSVLEKYFHRKLKYRLEGIKKKYHFFMYFLCK